MTGKFISAHEQQPSLINRHTSYGTGECALAKCRGGERRTPRALIRLPPPFSLRLRVFGRSKWNEVCANGCSNPSIELVHHTMQSLGIVPLPESANHAPLTKRPTLRHLSQTLVLEIAIQLCVLLINKKKYYFVPVGCVCVLWVPQKSC